MVTANPKVYKTNLRLYLQNSIHTVDYRQFRVANSPKQLQYSPLQQAMWALLFKTDKTGLAKE